MFATIMDTPLTTPTSMAGGGASGLVGVASDVRGVGVVGEGGRGGGGAANGIGVPVGADGGVGIGGGAGGGGSGVARSRDCYMAAITACHKAEDFPRALGLLQHMRGKVCASTRKNILYVYPPPLPPPPKCVSFLPFMCRPPAVSSLSVKEARRAPSRRCGGARVRGRSAYGHAWHEYTPRPM